jgi:hypothetical protein
MQFGLVCMLVPGHARNRPGIDGVRLPSAPGLIQAMSSPMVVTFQPSNGRRNQHREVGLPAALGESCGHVNHFLPWGLVTPGWHVLGEPAFVAAHVRCDAARPSPSRALPP